MFKINVIDVCLRQNKPLLRGHTIKVVQWERNGAIQFETTVGVNLKRTVSADGSDITICSDDNSTRFSRHINHVGTSWLNLSGFNGNITSPWLHRAINARQSHSQFDRGKKQNWPATSRPQSFIETFVVQKCAHPQVWLILIVSECFARKKEKKEKRSTTLPTSTVAIRWCQQKTKTKQIKLNKYTHTSTPPCFNKFPFARSTKARCQRQTGTHITASDWSQVNAWHAVKWNEQCKKAVPLFRPGIPSPASSWLLAGPRFKPRVNRPWSHSHYWVANYTACVKPQFSDH